MSARILVLDPESFIGAAVVKQLAASGWAEPVTAVPGQSRTLNATKSAQIAAALRDCAGVVNCAMGSAARLNANTDALVAALQQVPDVRSVVHVSSMSVYGPVEGLVNESAPLSSALGPYSAARVHAEKTLRAVRPDAVFLRPGIEYGAGGWLWSGRIAKLLTQKRLGDLGAGGDGWCNLVHVRDVALAVERTLQLEAARGQAFNLALSEPPTWNDYFTAFALKLGAVPVKRVGARRQRIESKLLAPPLKIIEILAGKARIPRSWLAPPIPGSLLWLCRHELRLDTRRAEQVLGMRWMPLEQGLDEAAACYRGALPTVI